jgi:hypothetical protein
MKVHDGSDSLLGNTSDFRADWRGLGLAGQTTDPDGNIASDNRDANGLATVRYTKGSRVDVEGSSKETSVLMGRPPGGSVRRAGRRVRSATMRISPRAGRAR